MPIIKRKEVPKSEAPKPEMQEMPERQTPVMPKAAESSAVLTQMVGQNVAISEMLNALTGRRIVKATFVRDGRGLITEAVMTVDFE